jgi:hypothetical protein
LSPEEWLDELPESEEDDERTSSRTLCSLPWASAPATHASVTATEITQLARIIAFFLA